MTKFATVLSDGLNVRANPHAKAKIITALNKGSRRPVLARDESVPGYVWLQIELAGGKSGWVYAKYVEESGLVHIPVPDAIEWKPILWLGGLAIALIAFLFLVTIQ